MSKKDDLIHKEARKPDFFIQIVDQVLLTLKPYKKIIIVAGFLVFFGGIGWGIWTWQQEKLEQKAQESYFQAERSYIKSQEESEKAKSKMKTLEASIESLKKDKKVKDAAKQINEKKKELEQETAKLLTGDFEKDYGSIVNNFKAVIKNYPKSNAALMSSLYLSKILSEANKSEEALVVLTKSGLDSKKNNLLSGLYLMRLGQIYANNKDCEKAVAVWGRVTKNEALAFLHGDANLKSAVCYEDLKMSDKALEVYSRSGSEGINNERARKIKHLIRGKRVTEDIVSASTGEVLVQKNTDVTEDILNKLTNEDLISIRLADKRAQSELDKIERNSREKKSSAAVKSADKYKRALALGKAQSKI